MPARRLKRKQKHQPEIITDPVESAHAAGLHYVSDAEPGIRRRRAGRGFTYIDPDGNTIQGAERERIEALAIPPAWTSVWICPDPDGHLQATGRDARGRKQYRYHPRWREVRDATKYHRMLLFGAALPTIRERVDVDLRKRSLSREKVLATVVRLLETTLIRVGNDEYAQRNNSYGLTTMRDRHVDIAGSHVRFKFKGKSGVRHTIEFTDRRLARIVKQCQDIPGYELFQYIDDDGQRQTISSADVNEYLKEISGEDFTAKDFRTWAGTVLACAELRRCDPATSKTALKKNVSTAIKQVAEQLGNTPAICRKCYVHPAILDAYENGAMSEVLEDIVEETDDSSSTLQPDESAVMALLRALGAGR